MRTEAMVMERHGGPDVLERREIDVGELGPRDVLVRVRAVALNHLDLWVRRGGPAFKLAFPHRLGSDVAGEIEAVGADVRHVAVGARVMLQPGRSCGCCAACLGGRDNLCRSYKILGENAPGGSARHLVVPETEVVPFGAGLGFVEAAALPLCTLTAWQMAYRKGAVRPGARVLVNAAGSGVSSLLIQLCKIAGAEVIASTSDPDKAERARALGADGVVVTRDVDLATEVKRLTGKIGVDVAFDHVGGTLFEKTLAAVRWGGKLVTCGATAGFEPRIDLRSIFFRQVEIKGSTMGRKSDLWEALPLVLAGRLRPVVDRVLPLWEARAAHEALEGRKVFGKIVLTVD
ncbi:MAG: zinc-binding dehydrogenase [Myxococcales bacterium]|nr:zinc-binding dehydrogenase [Myxococcales bacterium]